MNELIRTDPEIADLVRREEERQQRKLVLIAAENYASRAVLEAQGTVLTNKYAEGYPGRRYYSSCQEIDEVERLAVNRATRLFGADYANVQPHSGTQANAAVYLALLQPGAKVLSMSLAHGGHLSHGSPANFSGRWFEFTHYGVRQDNALIDYDELEKLARRNKPDLVVAGASSYPRVIDFERIHHIAEAVGAPFMVDMAHTAGLVAAGVHPSPVPWAQIVTATTHKTMRGPRGGFILARQEFAKRLDAAVFPGMQGGPLMHVIAAKAVCFHEAMQPDFVTYQRHVIQNARALADELVELGFNVVTGGTDNHIVLIDLQNKGITGKTAEEALDRLGISANRNAIPFDPLPPQTTSGLRLGTPAVTTRGLGQDEMRQVASIVHRALANIGNADVEAGIRQEVVELAERFPPP